MNEAKKDGRADVTRKTQPNLLENAPPPITTQVEPEAVEETHGEEIQLPETKEPEDAEAKPLQYKSIYAIVRNLSKPIGERFISSRKQGNNQIRYISWFNATKILDYYAPGWNYEVCKMAHINGCIAVTVRLTIPCAEGIAYREAVGYEKDDAFGFGDPFSNAESMALRRAASKFGLARHLYGV